MPKPKLMLTTDMADTGDTVVDTVDTVASDLPLLKPTPMPKPKLMLTTDMVDTVARGPLMPKLIPKLRLTMAVVTDTEAMVDTVDTAVDTVDMVDTVVDTTDKFY